MEKHIGRSLPTLSWFCTYSCDLHLLAESTISNLHNNCFFEKTGEHCLRGLPGAWRQGLKRLMTRPGWSCAASTSAVPSTAARPAHADTSLKSHAKAIVFIHHCCGYTYMKQLFLLS